MASQTHGVALLKHCIWRCRELRLLQDTDVVASVRRDGDTCHIRQDDHQKLAANARLAENDAYQPARLESA